MPVTVDRRVLRYAPDGITQEEIMHARAWLIDSGDWSNVTAADIMSAPVLSIVRNVARHYDGGWSAFIADLVPVTVR